MLLLGGGCRSVLNTAVFQIRPQSKLYVVTRFRFRQSRVFSAEASHSTLFQNQPCLVLLLLYGFWFPTKLDGGGGVALVGAHVFARYHCSAL